jgi:mono/diheme cytochrome c family protein
LSRAITILVLFFTLIISSCSAGSSDSQGQTSQSLIEDGKRVYNIQCASCHALEKDKVVVGPSLYAIATNASKRVEGQDARSYIEASILNPNEYVVPGSPGLMPSDFGQRLSEDELEALIAYMLTLK